MLRLPRDWIDAGRSRDTSTTRIAEPHGLVTRSIRWASARLLGYGYLKGLDNVSRLSDPALLQFEITCAFLLGGLFLLRLCWTWRIAGATRLPQDAPNWERFASRAVHLGLCASLFMIVLSGLGIALSVSTPGLGVVFLAAMIGLHEFSVAVLPLLLLIHIAGALWHHVVRRDGVLESKTGRLPVWS